MEHENDADSRKCEGYGCEGSVIEEALDREQYDRKDIDGDQSVEDMSDNPASVLDDYEEKRDCEKYVQDDEDVEAGMSHTVIVYIKSELCLPEEKVDSDDDHQRNDRNIEVLPVYTVRYP